jgi:hypothetical protein
LPRKIAAKAYTFCSPNEGPYVALYGGEPHAVRISHRHRMPRFRDDRPIIVFDRKCALCSGFAQFALRNDRDARFSALGGAAVARSRMRICIHTTGS